MVEGGSLISLLLRELLISTLLLGQLTLEILNLSLFLACHLSDCALAIGVVEAAQEGFPSIVFLLTG